MNAASFKHSLSSVNVDVCMLMAGCVYYIVIYVHIFEAKYLGN